MLFLFIFNGLSQILFNSVFCNRHFLSCTLKKAKRLTLGHSLQVVFCKGFFHGFEIYINAELHRIVLNTKNLSCGLNRNPLTSIYNLPTKVSLLSTKLILFEILVKSLFSPLIILG